MSIELGNRLAQLRKEKGISQEQLADEIGVSRQAISKWERGESSPDTDNLISLAKLYDISLDELLLNKKKEEPEVEIKDQPENSKVHIDIQGVHVTDKNRQVDVGINGIHVVNQNKEVHLDVKNVKTFMNNHKLSLALHSIGVILIIVAYLLIGFLLDEWGISATIFLLIPILGSIDACIKTKKASAFAMPILVTGIYVLASYYTNLWHPLWVLFFIIPIYYTIVGVIEKKENAKDKNIVIEEIDNNN